MWGIQTCDRCRPSPRSFRLAAPIPQLGHIAAGLQTCNAIFPTLSSIRSLPSIALIYQIVPDNLLRPLSAQTRFTIIVFSFQGFASSYQSTYDYPNIAIINKYLIDLIPKLGQIRIKTSEIMICSLNQVRIYRIPKLHLPMVFHFRRFQTFAPGFECKDGPRAQYHLSHRYTLIVLLDDQQGGL